MITCDKCKAEIGLHGVTEVSIHRPDDRLVYMTLCGGCKAKRRNIHDDALKVADWQFFGMK